MDRRRSPVIRLFQNDLHFLVHVVHNHAKDLRLFIDCHNMEHIKIKIRSSSKFKATSRKLKQKDHLNEFKMEKCVLSFDMSELTIGLFPQPK